MTKENTYIETLRDVVRGSCDTDPITEEILHAVDWAILEIANSNKTIARLSDEILESDKRRRQLSNSVFDLNKEIESLKATIEAQKRELKDHYAWGDNYRRKIDELVDEVDTKEVQVESLEAQLKNKQKTIISQIADELMQHLKEK